MTVGGCRQLPNKMVVVRIGVFSGGIYGGGIYITIYCIDRNFFCNEKINKDIF